jgi:hypothetical protein
LEVQNNNQMDPSKTWRHVTPLGPRQSWQEQSSNPASPCRDDAGLGTCDPCGIVLTRRVG